MRKLFPMLLFTLLLALLMAVPALAADFTYDDFSATLTVPDSYTMLTTSNLADHEDLLAKQGLTVEAAQADWAARGVRFQAWNAAGDMCIELSAVQDDFAMQYWDVNEVTSDERATYRLGCLFVKGHAEYLPELPVLAVGHHSGVPRAERKAGAAVRPLQHRHCPPVVEGHRQLGGEPAGGSAAVVSGVGFPQYKSPSSPV